MTVLLEGSVSSCEVIRGFCRICHAFSTPYILRSTLFQKTKGLSVSSLFLIFMLVPRHTGCVGGWAGSNLRPTYPDPTTFVYTACPLHTFRRVRDSCEERGRRLMTWFPPRLPKNVRTQTCRLTGVSCYFICTSKLTVWVGLHEFAAAGRWRLIEATANMFVHAFGDVVT